MPGGAAGLAPGRPGRPTLQPMPPHPPALAGFHPAVREWFAGAFSAPTAAQRRAWPAIARGESTLLLAPTGSGKTLAAFLVCLNRLMFGPAAPRDARCRVVYVSPLKALAVDVERNLRLPLAGIAEVATRRGDAFLRPELAVRTGDTPARERARFRRAPTDLLITTPESLYLILTSQVREALRAVDTVIVDEIHALAPTKRGAHLALSLERLEALCGRSLQRIGLSATARPAAEVARFLGGTLGDDSLLGGVAESGGAALDEALSEAEPPLRPRPVTIVDVGARKALELRIEVPVEDLAQLAAPQTHETALGAPVATPASIWTAIHPRLLELVRAHRSTLVFVNSRRLAERLAAALNELAGETIAYAHHGSVAREQRLAIEEQLKAGHVRALVATSTLELGIDMGAVDLVVQIEAPPSVASGLQRVGRAGHQVDAPSRAVFFPKYRGDLVACAALVEGMAEAAVEPIRPPRNPLDVLAQQIVAMVALEPWSVGALHTLVRRASPFATLGRRALESVLDLLSGRYASDDFATLRPRLTWDRRADTLVAREGARRVAIANAGTIPDRGLYGVFLAGAERGRARLGELDEEMVFESQVGDTFVLGASTWRIEEITHDRVVVSPAPGEPGRMPFWHGDAARRPVELGRRIGAFVRTLRALPRATARERLLRTHALEPRAAENLLRYLEDEEAAIGSVPDDRTLVIERCRDDLGDWRVCVLSPLGGRVLAAWALAAVAHVRETRDLEVDATWTDDGFVLRFPESDAPPEAELLLPPAEAVERLLLQQLGSTALFAARFRENAARALLLPRRHPGRRTPLWQQRKRAHDLLSVAARFPSFPIVLETTRECLREVFDLPALREVLRGVERREIRVVTADPAVPSPFASAILFGFVAQYLYDGDAPRAERRAQALAIDAAQLRELLGEAELRELLDAGVLEAIERELQRLEPGLRARSPDAVHDLLLRLGDLDDDSLRERSELADLPATLAGLAAAGRILRLEVAGAPRWVAVEHASRYRDALGVTLPPELPASLLQPVLDPLGDLVLRHARTHGPFTAGELTLRYGAPRGALDTTLSRAVESGRLVEGAFRPGGHGRELCDPEVLRALRRRSLARLRREAEPVDSATLGRFLLHWHGVLERRRGPDALLDAIERLQGAPLPASLLESEILPARVEAYTPADLDALAAAGEVAWLGLEPLGERDGRVALFLSDALPRLWRPREATPALSAREGRILSELERAGASFFGPLHEAAGGGFPGETLQALWSLVWRGLVTNDGFAALRGFLQPPPGRERRGRRPAAGAVRAFRSRRTLAPAAAGRWSLVRERAGARPSPTEWSAALAEQLLRRHGVVTREATAAEGVPGGFSAVYEVLQRMEERGRVRRGHFVAGVGALQFALPGVLERLRALRRPVEAPESVVLSATDPANPYGALLRWPAPPGSGVRPPSRSVGARVVLVDGAPAGWLARGGRALEVWLPEDEAERDRVAGALARALVGEARAAGRAGLLLEEIDGVPPERHPLAWHLLAAGFAASAHGFHLRRAGSGPPPAEPAST